MTKAKDLTSNELMSSSNILTSMQWCRIYVQRLISQPIIMWQRSILKISQITHVSWNSFKRNLSSKRCFNRRKKATHRNKYYNKRNLYKTIEKAIFRANLPYKINEIVKLKWISTSLTTIEMNTSSKFIWNGFTKSSNITGERSFIFSSTSYK